MLEQRIYRMRVYPDERAHYYWARSGWGKAHTRWLHLYIVKPPPARPFLPSDEALRNLVGTIYGIRLHKIIRFPDRDLFTVYGANKNIFTTRASLPDRAVRETFLADVARMAEHARDIPAHVVAACEGFLKECGFSSLIWDGTQVIVNNGPSCRWESNRVRGGVYYRPFRTLVRVCRDALPFTYAAAPS